MKCLMGITILLLINGCVLLPKTSSQLNCAGTVRNELKQGEWFCKDPLTSAITMKANFNKGQKDGRVELFYPNGITESITYWKDGMLEGPFKSYFKNGQKQFEFYYEKGIRSKSIYEWDETGEPVDDTVEN